MNKNILIVLGGAVLAAVLVAVLVQVTLGGSKKKVDPDSRAEILVAARDLKSTAESQDGDVVWQEWPKDSLFSGAIVRKEDQEADGVLDGRYARDVAKGEPLKRDAMLKAKTGNFVAASLGKGERAMSIKVKAESMVAGFIGPGSYVDVILTYQETIKPGKNEDPRLQMLIEMNIDKFATETVLENVRVLAIDQTVERDFDDEVEVGKTVTLAVPIRDAEKLALSDKMGTLVLAMRGVGDAELMAENLPTITDARLTNIGDEIYAEYIKMRGQKKAVSQESSIKIYNGASVSDTGF